MFFRDGEDVFLRMEMMGAGWAIMTKSSYCFSFPLQHNAILSLSLLLHRQSIFPGLLSVSLVPPLHIRGCAVGCVVGLPVAVPNGAPSWALSLHVPRMIIMGHAQLSIGSTQITAFEA